MKIETRIIPYGEVLSSLSPSRYKTLGQRTRVSKISDRVPSGERSIFITFSRDLDKSFIELFRRKATQQTKLLILNDGTSTDTLLARILELPVRTPERLYVLDSSCGTGKTHVAVFLCAVLQRLTSGLESDQADDRILDAKVEHGVLRAVSPNFERLDVPIHRIPQLNAGTGSMVNDFQIDEDGSFIYWPALDLHLGWRQLQQIVSPEAALKASQKSEAFNKRYGKAVQLLREEAGLARSDVKGISEKQLGRIENGECRLTANAVANLAKAHGLGPNAYLMKLAKTLEAEVPVHK